MRQFQELLIQFPGAVQHLSKSQPTSWKENGAEQVVAKRSQAFQIFDGQFCHDGSGMIVRQPLKTGLNPGDDLLDFEAIEQVIADVGDQGSGRGRRP